MKAIVKLLQGPKSQEASGDTVSSPDRSEDSDDAEEELETQNTGRGRERQRETYKGKQLFQQSDFSSLCFSLDFLISLSQSKSIYFHSMKEKQSLHPGAALVY